MDAVTCEAKALPWLSVAQMREVDRLMIEEMGISLLQMMENAGRHLAAVACGLLGGDAVAAASTCWQAPAATGAAGSSPPGTFTTSPPRSRSARPRPWTS